MSRFTLFTLGIISLGGLLSTGCSHEVSHSETDKPTLMGGHEHEEKTTYQNSDGSYSTDDTKVKSSN